MTPSYPQMVDQCKTTNGGLPSPSVSGGLSGMATEDQQFAVIGARLVAIREGFSDLNQRDWAERHQFSSTQYNNWERGFRRIPVECAEKLCLLYGLTLDFIYMGRRDGLSDKASKIL